MAKPNEDGQTDLVDKMRQLVDGKWGGDWYKAFLHYANKNNTNGTVEREELLLVLADAGIGNWVTRGMYADGIVKALDRDNNGALGWTEFETVFKHESGVTR